MQPLHNDKDPNKKEVARTENSEDQNMEEGVYLYNEDGTPMDTGDRTYISVNMPENDGGPDTTSDDVE